MTKELEIKRLRERKGSFYTPQIWVELSQKYLADTLGEDWQDEYYIWDCAAGTGNLLAGLTNKYHIFASTLDRQDVDVMKDRIENGANLAEDHVFQFDFLNDDVEKLPKSLREIIGDPEKRKKLIIYINPPYAEASSYGTESIPQVATDTKVFKTYKDMVGSEALNELFAQFFIRVYKEIPNSILAAFSTPKYITSEKFVKFRKHFKAHYLRGFICKSDTFDNVTGKFPIGFLLWRLDMQKEIKQIKTDIYGNEAKAINPIKQGTKNFYTISGKSIGYWRSSFYIPTNPIGYMIIVGPSMQSNNNTFITSCAAESYVKKGMVANIASSNLIEMSIYLAVRHVVKTTWLNNKDQYLYPNKNWEKDTEFQNNCLAYTLFNNNIQSKDGTNHWIPFTEYEVNARGKFDSNFMTQFIKGKLKKEEMATIFGKKKERTTPLVFSPEAQAVFDAGLVLWKYYHSQKDVNVNASLYDIREYFQGRNAKGKMNNKSENETYNGLIDKLRKQIEILARKIEPKVYEYGFLKS